MRLSKVFASVLFFIFPFIFLCNPRDTIQIRDSTFELGASFDDGGRRLTQFYNCKFNKLHVSFIESDVVEFDQCYFNSFATLNIIKAKLILFSNCEFSDDVSFYFMDMGRGGDSTKMIGQIQKISFEFSSPRIVSFVSPYKLDTLDFAGIDFLKNDTHVIGINPESQNNPTKIWLDPETAEKIIFDFSKYDLITTLRNMRGVKVEATYTDVFRVYSKILKVQQDNFYGAGIIRADTALHELQWRQFHRIEDGISKFMLNYSYNKLGVIITMGWFFLFFLVINFIAIRQLAGSVYIIESIRHQLFTTHSSFSRIPNLQRLGLAFLYTMVLFFGIHLEIDNFQFDKKLGVLYIFIMFVTGLFFTLSMGAILIIGK